MAKLDLKRLLDKKGWKVSDLSRASGVSQTVLRHLVDGVFEPTPHEHRLILEAVSKPDSPKPVTKAADEPAGQLDLFGDLQ